MHPLLECFLSATRYGWRRRGTILWMLALIWLPVQLMVAFLPTERNLLAKLLLESLAEPLWVGAVLHCCRAELRQKPIGALSALRRAARSYPRLVGIRTVLEMRILFGLVALIVPGLVMLARYALMDVLAICEDVGPTACRFRSRSLVAEHTGSMFAVVVAGSAIPMAASQLADFAAESLQSVAATIILSTVAVTLTALLPLTLFEFYRSRALQATLLIGG